MSRKPTVTLSALFFLVMAGAMPVLAQDVAVESQRVVPSVPGLLSAFHPNQDLDIDLEGDFAVLALPSSGASGHVLVLELSGGAWAEVAVPLVPSSPLGGDVGEGVGVSGNWIAVGQGSGEAADWYTRVSNVWSFAQRLDAPSVRLAVRATTNTGSSASPWGGGSPAAGFIGLGGFSAGETRNFQCCYRDDLTQTCGTGQNSTNAVSVKSVP